MQIAADSAALQILSIQYGSQEFYRGKSYIFYDCAFWE